MLIQCCFCANRAADWSPVSISAWYSWHERLATHSWKPVSTIRHNIKRFVMLLLACLWRSWLYRLHCTPWSINMGFSKSLGKAFSKMCLNISELCHNKIWHVDRTRQCANFLDTDYTFLKNVLANLSVPLKSAGLKKSNLHKMSGSVNLGGVLQVWEIALGCTFLGCRFFIFSIRIFLLLLQPVGHKISNVHK